tara:strand:+ start:662 stop:961 length:300 start_codon:yes stop_codon:yes gene_type:complete
MVIDKAKFKRIKNKVLKAIPTARTHRNTSGNYYVSDGEGNDLATEYMIPPSSSVKMAWFWLSEVIRIDKNIERTNPNRMSTIDFEKKFNRISKRNSRGI